MKDCWVGPSLAASLEPLAHRQSVASLSLFFRYYFGWCSSKLPSLSLLPYSWGRSNRYSDLWLYPIFLSPFKNITRMSMLKGLLRWAMQMWYSSRFKDTLTYVNHPFFTRVKILIFDTHQELSAIISPYKFMLRNFSEGRLFSSEKTCELEW